MAFTISDRIKETTTTTGTGTYTLAGAVTGFETFTANLSNGDTTYYCCTDNSDFEVGLGTFTSSGTTLARTTILSSSNSNSAVNWTSGTRTIFCTLPAAKAVVEDGSDNVTVGGDVSVGDDLTILGGVIDFKSNSGSPASLKMYCESSNAHFQTLQPQPHAASAANTLRLPNSGSSDTQDLVAVDITQTLTNKSLTAPILTGSDSAAGSILFKEDTDNGTNAVTLIGPASTADVTITLPNSAGTVALTSDIPSAGISSGNVATFTSGVADDDFLRVSGTAIEGRSASEVLSDIGGQASLTFGISNTNAVKIDSSSVADDEFARFTANGLESRSTSEVLSDIGAQASLTFGIANTNAVKIDSASVADDEFARFTANGLESRSAAEVLSDIGGQASLTFGISNTNAVKIDSASVADDEYARFTANGLESRSTSEVLSDIGASAAAGSSSIVTTGALDSGSITSGFGAIDNGSSTITTTGAISGGALTGSSLDLNGGELILDADADSSITSDTDDQIDVKLAGTDRIRLHGTGKLSVADNTTAFSTSHVIEGRGTSATGIALQMQNDENSAYGQLFIAGSSYNAFGAVAKDVWLYSPEGVSIGSNNDKLVKLLSHGQARLVVSGEHVGINTTAPANSGLFGGTQTSFNVMGSTAPEVRIKSSSGDCDTSLIASNSSSNFFIINGANGVALSHDGTSFGSASDERKKDIIENITDAEEKINKLRAVIGKYKVTKTYDADVLYTQEEKDDGQIPDGKDVGDVKIAKGTKKDGDKDDVRRSFLIAQDFLNNFPDIVSEVPEMDNNGNETSDTYYQLEYQGVIPLLVAGIKELSAKCADYEKRIKALESG